MRAKLICRSLIRDVQDFIKNQHAYDFVDVGWSILTGYMTYNASAYNTSPPANQNRQATEKPQKNPFLLICVHRIIHTYIYESTYKQKQERVSEYVYGITTTTYVFIMRTNMKHEKNMR